jgi:hypothetical protein
MMPPADTRRGPGGETRASQIHQPPSRRIEPHGTPKVTHSADSELVAAIEAVFDPRRFDHLAQDWYVVWARANSKRIVTWCSHTLVPGPAAMVGQRPLCPTCEAAAWIATGAAA